MAITVTVTIKGQEPTEVEMEEDTPFEDVIEQLADYWDVPVEEYVLLRGTEIFQGKTKISDAGLNQDDILVMVKRSEASAAKKAPTSAVSGELSSILQWLYDNPGLNPDTLKVIEDNKKTPRVLVFQDSTDSKKYRVTVDGQGKVKEYKPIK